MLYVRLSGTFIFRSDHLKSRLQADFPQITFHRPSMGNKSELVYVETLSSGAVIEELHPTSESEIGSSETDIGSSSPEHTTSKQDNEPRAIIRALCRNGSHDWSAAGDLGSQKIYVFFSTFF